MKVTTWFFLLFAFTTWSCNKDSASVTRPHDPWVFRSVLDSMPRMLTVALHDDVWAAYSAQNGAIYKVWKGGVNFDGAVYTTAHGPQPSTLGDAYYVNAITAPWTIIFDGKSEVPNIQYRGHRFDKRGKVQIHTELLLANGQKVTIWEQPEYFTNESGQPGMERLFTVSDLPKGASLQLKFNVSSIVHPSNIQTDGTLAVEKSASRMFKEREVVDDFSLWVDC